MVCFGVDNAVSQSGNCWRLTRFTTSPRATGSLAIRRWLAQRINGAAKIYRADAADRSSGSARTRPRPVKAACSACFPCLSGGAGQADKEP